MRFPTLFWLILSLIFIIFGVLCIVNPLHTMMFLAYVMAFVMLFSGIGAIAYFLQSHFLTFLVDGILSLLVGAVILFGGEDITQQFIPTIIALWLIFKGFLWLLHAYKYTRLGARFMRGISFMGMFYILLGGLFIIFPELLATLLSFVLGITLILIGGMGLYVWKLTQLR